MSLALLADKMSERGKASEKSLVREIFARASDRSPQISGTGQCSGGSENDPRLPVSFFPWFMKAIFRLRRFRPCLGAKNVGRNETIRKNLTRLIFISAPRFFWMKVLDVNAWTIIKIILGRPKGKRQASLFLRTLPLWLWALPRSKKTPGYGRISELVGVIRHAHRSKRKGTARSISAHGAAMQFKSLSLRSNFLLTTEHWRAIQTMSRI